MPTKTKPSIVFVHGIWADGSSFSKVIPALQAKGHEVMAAQYGLDTLAGDVAAVKRTLGRVSSPAILVGHSYGGTVITAAGTDTRVAGLVYIAALAPDADEMSQSQQGKFPVTDVFSHIEIADGRIGNYLGSDRDLEAIVRGIGLARELGGQRGFDGVRTREVVPGPKATRSELRELAQLASSSFGHPTGTCRIGTDELAVVDPELRVHGIQNLRVADSSVMPSVPAAATSTSAHMIGGKAAALLQA